MSLFEEEKNTVIEKLYRFVFTNGYEASFWFSKLELEWNGDCSLTSIDWAQPEGDNLVRSGPYHMKLSEVILVVDTGEWRETEQTYETD